MPESYPWTWAACWPEPCYVWPIALVGRVNSCGICGQREFVQVPEPRDGKACHVSQA